MSEKAYLVLADGSVYEGVSIGKAGTVFGELVFSTGMVGYQELLTDPSLYGNIVVQTFPLIGNYGVNDEDDQSAQAHLSGYVIRELCDLPSNFRMTGTLGDYLTAKNVVGIAGLDTRALTRKIRKDGVMNAAITTDLNDKEALLEQIKAFRTESALETVSCKESRTYAAENAKYNVAVIDFGCKQFLIDELVKRGCNVTVLPYNTTADAVKDYDGILLSNGPADPREDTAVLENVKAMFALSKPMFGVCLGHQILATALGATTEKMRYGHRGDNQPVINLENGKTYVTTQNHGYVVKTVDETICKVSHINANDKTCEGIVYLQAPAFSVQFLPDTGNGFTDTTYLFDQFISLLSKEEK